MTVWARVNIYLAPSNTLEGYAGKVKYAQFLHGGSEIILKPKRKTTWMDETVVENELVAEIPITKPPVEVPVIELFLKD